MNKTKKSKTNKIKISVTLNKKTINLIKKLSLELFGRINLSATIDYVIRKHLEKTNQEQK